ncbi:universal stress protein [Mycobacterium haemophilum]|uniref:Universal stress protein n=1 Tax=Mycobacterium haemophilum TaxID=29311 RepID=A0A0I9UC49_9MYCO|nr:universal stress protein [Mycobacterium haemophilum]AKN17851.1 universal stress protein [Mycobacterium haemophilum DSM 44634]KLO33506.1 universal stress protein [Mycobacterium haemophilum]KLO39033.1 universal stress protein [Mycobacterium haemophilum]KLO45447.1 universal stress protein [Mycobacterium haemophilum]KLO56598.1 universal stress protein [Mycobacterium haemophilum]
MSALATKYGILVGVDGSAESDAAIRFASREALMRAATITLMHVVAPIPDWPAPSRQVEIAEAWEANARDVIEQARKTALAIMGEVAAPDVHTEVVHSPVVPMLIGASSQAQMILVGSRGMGALGRFLLGSVSSGVVRHAHCPVAIIHNDDGSADDKAPVLVGVDGSPASEGAIELAFDEASRRGVDLVALHAWSDVAVFPILGMDWQDYETRGEEVLAERLAGWQEQYPDVHVQRRLVCDKPAHWLIEESQHAQLVVVGSHGRGGFPGMLLGSVGSALAQSAQAPLIIVRPG